MYHPMKKGYSTLMVKSEALEICDNGWRQNRLTPEECEQRLEVTETDIEVITKDIERLQFELNDLKLKVSKKFI